MSPPHDPPGGPDDPEPPPRPLMGVTFWLMILLCAVCVAAGAAVAFVLPRLLGPAGG